MSVVRAAALLLLCALASYLPGVLATEWRGTEGRRVQIAAEMVDRAEHGDPRAWMVPTLGWEDTFAKPPVYYWMLAAAIDTVGLYRWSMRMPSVLAIWAVALLAWLVLKREYGESAAWIAGLGTVASPVLLHDGPFAEIDPMFAAWTAGSLLMLGRHVARPDRWNALVAGLLGGIALLVKGPPYFMFFVPAALVWWRRRRLRGVLWFVAPLLALPLAYYVPLVQWYVQPDQFSKVAGDESVGRLVTYEWRHVLDAPLYVLRAAAVTLPLGLWTFYEYRSARPAHVSDRELVLRVCKAAALGGAAILIFFPGRATRYLLPMIPLYCVAVAPAVAAWMAQPLRLPAWVSRWTLWVGLLGSAALVVVAFLPPPFPGRSPAICLALAMLPVLTRNRTSLVAACLMLPVVAAWTVFADREDHRSEGSSGIARNAAVLRSELDARGLMPLDGRVATWGHMNSGLLLDLDAVPPGDELFRREPTAPWLLVEDPYDLPLRPVPGYREELRLQWRDRDWVLLERER